MNKLVLTATFFFIFNAVSAQKNSPTKDYYKWSAEVNAGNNIPIYPISPGWPDQGLVITKFQHFNIGVVKMYNTLFGVKFDLATNYFSNENRYKQKTKKGVMFDFDKPFKTQEYRAGAHVLMNLMSFLEKTRSIGLYLHGGLQYARLNMAQLTENNFSFLYGISPQIKISTRFSGKIDFTTTNNFRQQYFYNGIARDSYMDYNYLTNPNYDPKKKPDPLLISDNDVKGLMYNMTLGLVYSWAKKLKGMGIPEEQIINIMDKKEYLNVFYDFNKDEPNEGNANTIIAIIDFLKTSQNNMVIFRGYADINGGEDLSLSQRRSENLKKLFVANNIDTGRISILTTGEDDPDKTNLQSARRVRATLFIIKN